MKTSSVFRLQSGVTLIELMISLTIGLLISGVIASVFLANRQSYKVQEDLARMQENGRFAMQLMAKDIQAAGYRGCVPIGTSAVNLIGNSFASKFGEAVVGNEALASTWNPALDAAISSLTPAPMSGVNSDVVTVRGAQPGSARTTAVPTGNSVTYDSLTELSPGDSVLLAKCDNTPVSNIFTITNTTTPASGTLTANAAITALAPAGSNIRKMLTTTYYIAQPAGAATPSLYRQQGNAAPQEVVQNVAGMQVLYGVDTAIAGGGGGSDGVIDQYDTAAVVNAVVLAGGSGWDRVRSVKINLLLVSSDANLALNSSTYTADGFNYPADRRLKQGFTTVISLRNRTL